MAVYILKFDRPLGNPANKHGQAQFYVGYAKNVEGRLHYHLAGRGACITRAAVQQGIGFEVVLVIKEGDRALERKIKAQKNTYKWLKRNYPEVITA